MLRILSAALLAVLIATPAAARVDAEFAAESEILAVMRAAEAGWNAGDLEAYMQSYWKSEELRFAGADRVTYGWEATLAKYRASYPDTEAMGQLTFADLDITLIAADAALVFGSWRLEREGDEPGAAPRGLFTLLLRKLPEGWRIVHDHTSSGQGPVEYPSRRPGTPAATSSSPLPDERVE